MNTQFEHAGPLNIGIRPALQAGKRFYQNEIRQLLNFVRTPKRSYADQNKARANGLARLACLLSFCLLIGMSGCIPQQVAEWAGVLSERELAPTIRDALFVAGVAPIVEELVFRAGLRNLRYTLIVGPLVIALFAGAWQVALALPLIWGCLLLWYRLSGRIGSSAVVDAAQHFTAGRNYLQHYPLIFHLYTVGFALIHIQNYFVSYWIGLILLPLMVLPQWMAGLMLGYLRIRHSVKMTIFAHMSWNGLGMIALWIDSLH